MTRYTIPFLLFKLRVYYRVGLPRATDVGHRACTLWDLVHGLGFHNDVIIVCKSGRFYVSKFGQAVRAY